MADFVDDVVTAADELGGDPVLVGHSMGGFVVQRYLARRRAPAAILLASVPPRGMRANVLRFWRRHPLLALRASTIGPPEAVFTHRTREALFSPGTPEEVVVDAASRCQPESIRAMWVDLLLRVPPPVQTDTPLLVLGAEHDGSIAVEQVHDTARVYGAEVDIVAGMGHNMMQETGWQDVAERMCRWLGRHGL